MARRRVRPISSPPPAVNANAFPDPPRPEFCGASAPLACAPPQQHLREWQQPVADAVTEPPSKQVGSKGEIGAARAANVRGVLRADLPDHRPGPGQVVGRPAVAAVQVDASASAWRRVGAHVVVVAAGSSNRPAFSWAAAGGAKAPARAARSTAMNAARMRAARGWLW